MSPPLTVAVALCTYNGSRHIAAQLTSILAQTRAVDHIVVADDSSGDDTVDIVERTLADSGVRFTVLRGDAPLRVTANFERAVLAAEGDIIVLSDQDDVWAPDKIERMTELFGSRPELAALFTDARLVDATGSPLGGTLFEALEIAGSDFDAIRSGDAFATLLRRNLATGATMAFRREWLPSLVPFDRRWVHDEWITIVLAALAPIDFLSDALIDYRQHGANQIGAAKPGFRRRLSKILESREGNWDALAARVEGLRDRLVALGARTEDVALAEEKIAHERFRAGLPASRVRRLWPVLRHARTGAYDRFSSRRNLDILRDLLQAP